jgi:hypothetical protein
MWMAKYLYCRWYIAHIADTRPLHMPTSNRPDSSKRRSSAQDRLEHPANREETTSAGHKRTGKAGGLLRSRTCYYLGEGISVILPSPVRRPTWNHAEWATRIWAAR